MLEYKVILAKSADEAERLMNKMSKDGWRVISTSYWYKWSNGLMITFEREI